MTTLIRPIKITIDTIAHNCCSPNCILRSTQGYFDYCGTERLEEGAEGMALRTVECLRDAKEMSDGK